MPATGPTCPTCGTRLPFWRWPRTVRQALLGGWTCRVCGTESDRAGRLTRPTP